MSYMFKSCDKLVSVNYLGKICNATDGSITDNNENSLFLPLSLKRNIYLDNKKIIFFMIMFSPC